MIKKIIITEVIWVGACLIAAYLSYVFLATGTAVDINMHDTYKPGGVFGTNLSSAYFVFNYFIIIGLWAYLIRAVYFNFNEIITAILLLIFTGLVLLFLNDIIFVIHPPVLEPAAVDNTSALVKGLFYGGSYSNFYLWGIRAIKAFLMLILAFTGFMIGKKWPKGIVT